MRKFHCSQHCYYRRFQETIALYQKKPRAYNIRGYASGQQVNTGFSSSKPSGPEAKPYKDKSSPLNTSKPYSKDRGSLGEKFSKEDSRSSSTWRFPRVTPLKIAIFSVASFIAYELYLWHTKPSRFSVLDPRFFHPSILEARDKVSSTSSILHLQSLPKGQNTEVVSSAWRKGVWSVQVIQPELQIQRPYTPLPPTETTEPEQFRLFVRKEPEGEVSSFLHRINRGTIVGLRGPKIEYEIPEDVDEILFLAGGTGIAPALQVAHTLSNYRTGPETEAPKLHILWANRRREDSYKCLDPLTPSTQQEEGLQAGMLPKLRGIAEKWRTQSQTQAHPQSQALAEEVSPRVESEPRIQNPLVAEVETLKAHSTGKIIVDYFVDEESSFITEPLLRDHLSSISKSIPPKKSQSENQESAPRRKLILISGPDGFVEFYAGPKGMKKGKQIQGPLGGLLGRINSRDWEVWKL